MKKFIPYSKQTKKKKRAIDKLMRRFWGETKPATREMKNKKAYDRKREKERLRKERDRGKQRQRPAERRFCFAAADGQEDLAQFPCRIGGILPVETPGHAYAVVGTGVFPDPETHFTGGLRAVYRIFVQHLF